MCSLSSNLRSLFAGGGGQPPEHSRITSARGCVSAASEHSNDDSLSTNRLGGRRLDVPRLLGRCCCCGYRCGAGRLAASSLASSASSSASRS
eukprot:scaffold95860_cov53-Phaeocystis_antarctica.AAC.1